jgi:hypothetical protein
MSKSTYQTDDLPFASYLLSSGRLRFVECRANGGGRLAFAFDDPQDEGDAIRIEYEAGAKVAAVTYYDAIRRLRRIMTQTTNKGERDHGYNRYRS